VSEAGTKKSSRWQALLLSWYAASRRDLPWRRTRDPYAIWISETMLQQTRVDTVIPYYERFLRALPTVATLAEAAEDQVLALWSGLGYYRRARMLHAAARQVARVHGGELPREAESLRELEGVGAYTAGAVASIAFGQRAPVVDGNVARVLARLFAIDEGVKSARGTARLWELARDLVSNDGPAADDPGAWNQALMELGATVCLPRTPRCGECPVSAHCAAHRDGIESELPRSVPRKPAREVFRVAVVLVSANAVLLARRRPGALFGGLWEPPGVEGALDTLRDSLGIEAVRLEAAGELTHILSHRRLRVEVHRGRLGRRRRFPAPGPEYDVAERVALAALGEVAQSRLARRILEVANVVPSGLF
jgi:A/G-specific adenine glycosylase